MTSTTGTFQFFPSTAELLMTAYGRIGIRRTEMTQQHLADAQNEANFVQVELSNKQPNLWSDVLYSVDLTAGTATYTLDPTTICFIAVYVTTYDSANTPIDRILSPLSAYEYSALPNKTVQSPPNQYWFNRLVVPTITLWPVPDDSTTYTLNIRYLKQLEDASFVNGTVPQIPYRWIDAFVSMLAARLGDLYPDTVMKTRGPNALTDLWAKADRAWKIAATEDVESTPIFIIPGLAGYTV